MADENNNAGSWPQPYSFGTNPESDEKWFQEHSPQQTPQTEEEQDENPVANISVANQGAPNNPTSAQDVVDRGVVNVANNINNNGNQEVKPDPNVMGYDKYIFPALDEALERTRPESEEERKKRERKEKSKKIVAAITDGLGALSNLFFTSQYAPNMYNHEKQSALTPLERKIEEAKAERKAREAEHLNFALQRGNAQNARAKTLREMEAQAEAQRLAREKAARDAEKHQWQAALQPDLQREQAGKADRAESQAVTARYEATYAPQMQQAKLNTENARTEAQRAAAANSRASAAAHGRSEKEEFFAWDEYDNEYKFKSQAAADAFAIQHGTYHEVDVEETTETNSEDRGKTTSTKKKKGGYPVRPSKGTMPGVSDGNRMPGV